MTTPGYWSRVAGLPTLVCVALVTIPSLACSRTVAAQADSVAADQQTQYRVTFDRGGEAVLDAITALLVERDEMSADVASDWITQSRSGLAKQEWVRLTSRSVNVSAVDLRDLIDADQTRFVTDSGGRYFVTIPITPQTRTQTTVEVIATLIGVTPGPGPLGGRPLTSNGAIERAILDALRAAMN
jgi:hypothetical protein